MRRAVLLVGFIALAALSGCVAFQPADGAGFNGSDGETRTATVTRVVDGDTVDVTFADGSEDTVRLLGVDTPEVHAENAPAEFEGVPETEAGTVCLERWGERASAFAERRLAGANVTVRTDPSADRRGSYGRLLAYIETPNGTFNRALLSEGLARLYDSTFSERDAYADAEARAQESGTGLWGACRNPEETPSGPLAVSFHPDPVGNDNENLTGEYVVLRAVNDTVNLTGWALADAAGHTYTFPRTTLAANESVRVVTGSGIDGPGVRYWNRTGAVWNNGGDTLTLRAGERVVLEARY